MGEPGQAAFRTQLAWALVVAVLLRVGLAFVPVDPHVNPDSHAFESLAVSLAHDGRLVYADEGAPGHALVAFRSLLYPAFLAPFVDRERGAVGGAALPAQAALGVLVVAAMALLARRAFGEAVGAVTAWIGALYAPLVLCERQFTSEALFTPLLVFGTYAFARAWGGHGVRWAAVAGLALGLATLTRPAGAAAALATLVVGALARPRVGLRVLAVFALVFLAALVPALARNRALLGAPVLLTSGGMNAWIGWGRGTVGDAWVVMARLLPARGELGTDRWFYADTWAHRAEIAGALPAMLVAKARTFFTPLTRDPWFVPYRVVWPLAALGALGPWAARSPDRWLLVAIVASQVAMAMASVPWSRYRSPLEPLLWPLAALSAVALWRGGAAARSWYARRMSEREGARA